MASLNSCIQYGCGLSAPDGWLNFDASPTLRAQRIPVLGKLLGTRRVSFPRNVRYGDVVRGLPVQTGSCRAVYSSHVLEHLSLEDCHAALRETIRVLKQGGRFRLVVPDLEALCSSYISAVSIGDQEASHRFMRSSYLGVESRPTGIKSLIKAEFGNSKHLWMWDRYSMHAALAHSGFSFIRAARFGDSEEDAFKDVEEQDRFHDAIAFEAIK